MSSLSQQLQQHRDKHKHSHVLREKHAKTAPSLLLDVTVAAAVPVSDIQQRAWSSLQSLLLSQKIHLSAAAQRIFEDEWKVDPRFMDATQSLEFKELLQEFCDAISHCWVSLPALYCLEYLLRQFHIHHLNIETILGMILPYHDTNVFVRFVQLLDIPASIHWKFLKRVQEKRTVLKRSLIVENCRRTPSLLHFILETMERVSSRNSPRENTTILSFATMVTIESFSSPRASKLTEDSIRVVIRVSTEGLRNVEKTELHAASIVMLTQVSLYAALSVDTFHSIMNALWSPVRKKSASTLLTATLPGAILFSNSLVASMKQHKSSSSTKMQAFPSRVLKWMIAKQQYMGEVLVFVRNTFDADVRPFLTMLKDSLEAIETDSESTKQSAKDWAAALEKEITNFQPLSALHGEAGTDKEPAKDTFVKVDIENSSTSSGDEGYSEGTESNSEEMDDLASKPPSYKVELSVAELTAMTKDSLRQPQTYKMLADVMMPSVRSILPLYVKSEPRSMKRLRAEQLTEDVLRFAFTVSDYTEPSLGIPLFLAAIIYLLSLLPERKEITAGDWVTALSHSLLRRYNLDVQYESIGTLMTILNTIFEDETISRSLNISSKEQVVFMMVVGVSIVRVMLDTEGIPVDDPLAEADMNSLAECLIPLGRLTLALDRSNKGHTRLLEMAEAILEAQFRTLTLPFGCLRMVKAIGTRSGNVGDMNLFVCRVTGILAAASTRKDSLGASTATGLTDISERVSLLSLSMEMTTEPDDAPLLWCMNWVAGVLQQQTPPVSENVLANCINFASSIMVCLSSSQRLFVGSSIVAAVVDVLELTSSETNSPAYVTSLLVCVIVLATYRLLEGSQLRGVTAFLLHQFRRLVEMLDEEMEHLHLKLVMVALSRLVSIHGAVLHTKTKGDIMQVIVNSGLLSRMVKVDEPILRMKQQHDLENFAVSEVLYATCGTSNKKYATRISKVEEAFTVLIQALASRSKPSYVVGFVESMLTEHLEHMELAESAGIVVSTLVFFGQSLQYLPDIDETLNKRVIHVYQACLEQISKLAVADLGKDKNITADKIRDWVPVVYGSIGPYRLRSLDPTLLRKNYVIASKMTSISKLEKALLYVVGQWAWKINSTVLEAFVKSVMVFCHSDKLSIMSGVETRNKYPCHLAASGTSMTFAVLLEIIRQLEQLGSLGVIPFLGCLPLLLPDIVRVIKVCSAEAIALSEEMRTVRSEKSAEKSAKSKKRRTEVGIISSASTWWWLEVCLPTVWMMDTVLKAAIALGDDKETNEVTAVVVHLISNELLTAMADMFDVFTVLASAEDVLSGRMNNIKDEDAIVVDSLDSSLSLFFVSAAQLLGAQEERLQEVCSCLLSKARSARHPAVRFAVMLTCHHLWKQGGMAMFCTLGSTLNSLCEFLDDPHDCVESEARAWKLTIEQVTGENIDSKLK